MELRAETDWTIEQGSPVGPQVYRILRKRIIRAELTPGSLISESEIARAFSLSRQPVREAFIKLSEDGLVEVRPQRGTLVRKISMDAVRDARFVREAIEADVVKLVAEKSDPAVVSELRAQIALQRAVAPSDHKRFMKLDELFHRTLSEAAGKPYAWKIIEDVKAQMDRVRYLSLLHFPMNKLIAQHEAVVDAIEKGTPERADTALREHLREILTDLPAIAKAKPEFFEAIR
ncbi:GntR family transcriptional regulator [Pelagibius sp. Alg239-R121]|uniref:GntR family transcriptional regulator n=1 Tax=Pelagibius sp. Alg239-R121 TaxID=2993448 RepID=UPI0024A7A327|nr:GntR family transcriptional regulator [Pelagibius sp. Alg239-R121]